MLAFVHEPPRSRRPWSDILAELERRHREQTGPRWHLVQVVGPASRDRHAVEWLSLRGYEPYYPMVRTMRRLPQRQLSRRQRRDRVSVMRQVLEPMFSHYVLVRFDQRVAGWRDIFFAVGVKGIVCEQGRPVPIADDLIERLKAAEVDGAIPGATPAAEIFRLGQLVEVIDGPFQAFRGEIHRIRTMSIDGLDYDARMTVTLNLFGRLTPAQFDACQLIPVNLSAI